MKASLTDNTQYEVGTSWMWDHHSVIHGSDYPVNSDNFQFETLKTFKDPLTRQIEEANRIKLALNNNKHEDITGSQIPIVSLNRKHEYFQSRQRYYTQD